MGARGLIVPAALFAICRLSSVEAAPSLSEIAAAAAKELNYDAMTASQLMVRVQSSAFHHPGLAFANGTRARGRCPTAVPSIYATVSSERPGEGINSFEQPVHFPA